MDAEVRSEYFNGATGSFSSFIENYKGRAVAEEYEALQQRIQIEKYSPVRSAQSLNDLYNDIVKLYPRISK